MGAIHKRYKWIFRSLSILGILFFAASANAEIFSTGFPGLSSLGGYLGGPSGVGDKAFPRVGDPVFYAGWMNDRGGMTYEISGTFAGLFENLLSHRYPLRGVWLGLAETVSLRDNVGLVLSGWVLLPDNSRTSELDGIFDEPPFIVPFEWERTPTNWYFLDGLLAYRCAAGMTALAGFRYEYFTSHFRKLNPPVANDTGDVKIDNYIPLLGVQWSYADSSTNLLFRTVGFPVVFGNFRLTELFTGEITTVFDARGNYHSGYFLEAFSEYSRRCGSLDVGVFGRWNLLYARSNPETGFSDGEEGIDSKLGLALRRTSWTLGGRFSFAFNMPL